MIFFRKNIQNLQFCYLMRMKMMMNCFFGMVDRRKAFSLIFSRDHCQRSSTTRISDSPWAGFELAQNLSWMKFRLSWMKLCSKNKGSYRKWRFSSNIKLSLRSNALIFDKVGNVFLVSMIVTSNLIVSWCFCFINKEVKKCSHGDISKQPQTFY